MLHGNDGQRTVTVNKEDALATIKTNADAHWNDYLDAVKGYHLKMREFLLEQTEELKECTEGVAIPPADLNSVVDVYELGHAPIPPQEHMTQYNRYIAMFEWEQSDVLNLNAQEFENLILDKWHWKQQFENTKALYSEVH